MAAIQIVPSTSSLIDIQQLTNRWQSQLKLKWYIALHNRCHKSVSMKIIYLFFLLLFSCRPSNQLSELVRATNEKTLEGTVWLLFELNEKEIGSAENQKPIFVVFETSENKVRGFAGCNSFMGSYSLDRSTISATLASTRMYCDGMMEIEMELTKVLSTPTKYHMEENHLFLKIDGKTVAKFRAEVKTSG